jgi:hypothetical protein
MYKPAVPLPLVLEETIAGSFTDGDNPLDEDDMDLLVDGELYMDEREAPLDAKDQTYFLEQSHQQEDCIGQDMEKEKVVGEDEAQKQCCCVKLKEQIKVLYNRISYLQSKIDAMRDSTAEDTSTSASTRSLHQVIHWRKAKDDANMNFKDAARDALRNLVAVHGTRFTSARVAQLLVSVVWSFDGGVCIMPFMVRQASEWLRNNVYPSHTREGLQAQTFITVAFCS